MLNLLWVIIHTLGQRVKRYVRIFAWVSNEHLLRTTRSLRHNDGWRYFRHQRLWCGHICQPQSEVCTFYNIIFSDCQTRTASACVVSQWFERICEPLLLVSDYNEWTVSFHFNNPDHRGEENISVTALKSCSIIKPIANLWKISFPTVWTILAQLG